MHWVLRSSIIRRLHPASLSSGADRTFGRIRCLRRWDARYSLSPFPPLPPPLIPRTRGVRGEGEQAASGSGTSRFEHGCCPPLKPASGPGSPTRPGPTRTITPALPFSTRLAGRPSSLTRRCAPAARCLPAQSEQAPSRANTPTPLSNTHRTLAWFMAVVHPGCCGVSVPQPSAASFHSASAHSASSSSSSASSYGGSSCSR